MCSYGQALECLSPSLSKLIRALDNPGRPHHWGGLAPRLHGGKVIFLSEWIPKSWTGGRLMIGVPPTCNRRSKALPRPTRIPSRRFSFIHGLRIGVDVDSDAPRFPGCGPPSRSPSEKPPRRLWRWVDVLFFVCLQFPQVFFCGPDPALMPFFLGRRFSFTGVFSKDNLLFTLVLDSPHLVASRIIL